MSRWLQEIKQQYDFQSNYADLEGGRLHYLDEGQGPTVVLLHGNPSWSFMYRDLVRALRDRFRVLVPDHMGCGLSSHPPEDCYSYTLEQRILDLESLLERLGVGCCSIVAHDWGGLIGFGWATRHASQVDKLVVLNSAAFGVPEGTSLHWTIRLARQSGLAPLLVRRLNLFCIGAGRLGFSQSHPAEIRRGYFAPYDSWENRLSVLRFVQDIPLETRHPTYPTVREVEAGLSSLSQKDLLICWGERDFVFDGAFLDRWISLFPRAFVHRMRKAGHYVLEDASADVIPTIRDFLGSGA